MEYNEADLRHFARLLGQEWGVIEPDPVYVSQAEALRKLEKAGIRRTRLNRMIREGKIKVRDKENFEIRNSSVRIFYEDVLKYMK